MICSVFRCYFTYFYIMPKNIRIRNESFHKKCWNGQKNGLFEMKQPGRYSFRLSDCRKSLIFYLTGIVKGFWPINMNYADFKAGRSAIASLLARASGDMRLQSRSYQGLARWALRERKPLSQNKSGSEAQRNALLFWRVEFIDTLTPGFTAGGMGLLKWNNIL